MAPPSESWRVTRPQSNEPLARRSRPGRRVLRRFDRPLHTHRRSRPTYRRRRRRRPPVARRPRCRRCHGRSGDARRATTRAAGGALACARVRRAREAPMRNRARWRATARECRLAPMPARGRPGRARGRRRAPAAGPRRRSRSARSRTRAASRRIRRSGAPATAPATHSGRTPAVRVAPTTWRNARTTLVRASRRSRTSPGARGRARASFDATRAGITTPQRSRAGSSPVRPARRRRARGDRPAPARGRQGS